MIALPPPTLRGEDAAHCHRSSPLTLLSAADRRQLPPPLLPTAFIHHRRHLDVNSVPPDSSPLPLPLQQELDLPQQVAAFVVAPPTIDLPHCCPLVQDTGVFLLIMVPFQPEEDASQMHQRSGISRVREVLRDTQFLAHPSVEGARGYDIHTREMMVELCKSGNPVSQMMICSI
jgi:hypothetical protein